MVQYNRLFLHRWNTYKNTVSPSQYDRIAGNTVGTEALFQAASNRAGSSAEEKSLLRGVHEIDVDLRRSEGQRKYADFEIWLRCDQLLKRFALLGEIAQVDKKLQELEEPTVVSVSEQKTEKVPETEECPIVPGKIPDLIIDDDQQNKKRQVPEVSEKKETPGAKSDESAPKKQRVVLKTAEQVAFERELLENTTSVIKNCSPSNADKIEEKIIDTPSPSHCTKSSFERKGKTDDTAVSSQPSPPVEVPSAPIEPISLGFLQYGPKNKEEAIAAAVSETSEVSREKEGPTSSPETSLMLPDFGSSSRSLTKTISELNEEEKERVELAREKQLRDDAWDVMLVQNDLDRMFRAFDTTQRSPRSGNNGQRTPCKNRGPPCWWLGPRDGAASDGAASPDRKNVSELSSDDASGQKEEKDEVPVHTCQTWADFLIEKTRDRKRRNRQRKRQKLARGRNARAGLPVW